jgi:hypothetical protein
MLGVLRYAGRLGAKQLMLEYVDSEAPLDLAVAIKRAASVCKRKAFAVKAL